MDSRTRRTSHVVIAASGALAATVILPSSGHAAPEPTLEEVEKQVDSLYEEVEDYAEEFNEAEADLKEAQAKFNETQRNITAQENRINELRQGLGAFAAEQYRSTGASPTVQLLAAEEPEKYLQQLSTLAQLGEQQAAQLERLNEARRKLVQYQADSQRYLAELETAREQMAKKQGEIRTRLQKAQKLKNSLQAEQRAKLSESRQGSGVTPGNLPAPSGRAAEAIEFAKRQLGEPYSYGSEGPNSWDCSGLTQAAWGSAGVRLSRTARQQWYDGVPVSKSDLKPGDLVFFRGLKHVGIYVGNGMMIHAPRTGTVVRYESIESSENGMPYDGARRVGV